MSVINHLIEVQIQSAHSSSTFNLGNSIQIHPSDNTVQLGKAGTIGDFSINANGQKNVYIDPDFLSQIAKE
jgi:hypothetical protein